MPVQRVIFACVHNAGRSQMAAAFFATLADPMKAVAASAGTRPGDRVHPEVVDVMRELGIDLSGQRPQKLTEELARDAFLLVTMGCGDECPYVPGLKRDDWPLDDPKGRPLAEVRRIRDDIRGRVAALVEQYGWQRSADISVRSATLDDLQALTDIYNHYIVHTAITFDLQTFTAATRRGWFDDHSDTGPHRLLVATGADGGCLGYATSSRWRPKPAYDGTVEVSVYCHPDARGRGCGSALYRALFDALERENVQTLVAGVALPNPASLSLHERFGFRPVGVFHAVGRKFDQFWDVAWFERPLRIGGPQP